MSLNTITHDAVREALRTLRQANSLQTSPLLFLNLVSLRLRSDRLADTPHARSWALGRCIEDAVESQLRRMRGVAAGQPSAQLSASEELAQLQQDLLSGSADCLDWALVHWRYLSQTRQLVRDVGRALGMTERTVQNRVSRGVAALTDRLRQLELEVSRQQEVAASAPMLDAAPENGAVANGRRMVSLGVVLRVDGQQGSAYPLPTAPLSSSGQVEGAACHPSTEFTAYRQGRIAEWSQPRYRLDNRFVELSLLVDLGEESQSGRWQAKEERFTGLRDVLAAVSEPAVVLLGPPGSGKSSLLRRLEMDLSCEGLRGEGSTPFTFLVSLNQYRPPAPDGPIPAPAEWLAARWTALYPQLPPLAEVAARHRMLFLLDGLNELPHRTPEEYRALIASWRQFLQEAVTPGSGHRAVIACRSLDYSAPLSAPAMRVPMVQLEPMTDDTVRTFLERYSPASATQLWEQLRGTAVLDLMRRPFFLRQLVETAAEAGSWDGDLAALITTCVRRALVIEIERHNPRLEPNGLLDARDHERIVSGRGWRDAYELPERGTLIKQLAMLAQGMPVAKKDSASAPARISYAEALKLLRGSEGSDGGEGGDLSDESAVAVIRVGGELGLLDEDRATDEVMFQHRLIRQFFAARSSSRVDSKAMA